MAGRVNCRVFIDPSPIVEYLPSKEIRFLSKILLNDPRSTLCKNVWFLSDLTNVNIIETNKFQMKRVIPIESIPDNDKWRINLLSLLLEARKNKNWQQLNLNKNQLDEMIESLCIS